MPEKKSCLHDICPHCLKEESETLWLEYYEQYRTAVNTMLQSKQAALILLPLLNITSTYVELWVKVIGRNYGLGSGISVTAGSLKGHNLSDLMERLLGLMDWEEIETIKDDFLTVWDIIGWLADLTSDEHTSLSEATRYPETKKQNYALNPCLIGHLTGLCDKFPAKTVVENIQDLMEISYNIYNKIYEIRII